MSLSLDKSSGLAVVRAPIGTPMSTIERFLSQERGWIEKQQAKFKASCEAADRDGKLTASDIKALAEKMRPVLSEKLPVYAERLGVEYGKVTIRAQKSKWGSCSGAGNLNFNCLLMLAPEEVLDYVIVHELCHRKHMDHSHAFWAMVETVVPDHTRMRKWLRENGGALLKRAEPQ